MAAGTYNWTLEQGTTVLRTLTWRDSNSNLVDLTGAAARMQLRASVTSASVVLELLSTGAAGSRLILGGTAGTITIDIDDTHTSALPAPGPYVYDLEVQFADGTVDRVLKGTITVDPEVTR